MIVLTLNTLFESVHFVMNRVDSWSIWLKLSIALSVALLPSSAHANEEMIGAVSNPIGPYVCIGATPEEDTSSWQAINSGSGTVNCPQGYALYGATPQPGNPPSFTGICCKLPKSDILTSEVSEHPYSCPAGSVVTGGRPKSILPCVRDLASCKVDCDRAHDACRKKRRSAEHLLRCTKLNLSRYQLSRTNDVATVRLASHFSQRSVSLTPKRSIPLAIRYGIDRGSKYSWNYSVCAGRPWGSLFAGRLEGRSKKCEAFLFDTLEYRGLPGDPPRGTPVKMFPDCEKLSDLYDPNAYCVDTPK